MNEENPSHSGLLVRHKEDFWSVQYAERRFYAFAKALSQFGCDIWNAGRIFIVRARKSSSNYTYWIRRVSFLWVQCSWLCLFFGLENGNFSADGNVKSILLLDSNCFQFLWILRKLVNKCQSFHSNFRNFYYIFQDLTTNVFLHVISTRTSMKFPQTQPRTLDYHKKRKRLSLSNRGAF